MRIPSRPAPLPWITWGKAGASQLIVWHHLVHYGPLAPQVERLAPDLLRWLNTRALMAVQVFLVIAGFLAARSLWPRPDAPRVTLHDWPQRVWQRYRRLAPPYLAALLAAMLCAALARAWMSDADTPAAPTVPQALAHALMLQDVLSQPALSAGVWYVAMDLQLFALLALLAALVTKNAHRFWPLALLVGAALASLCVFNLDSSGDIWAPYFFGAYALGVLTAWGASNSSVPGGKAGTTALVGMLLAAALALEWRDRIALAGLTALVLLWQPYRWTLARSRLDPLMQWLAKVSYAVFLLHYPVSMAVNTLVMQLWPAYVSAHAAGLLASWMLSLACGWLLWYGIEAHGSRLRVAKKARGTPASHATT